MLWNNTTSRTLRSISGSIGKLLYFTSAALWEQWADPLMVQIGTALLTLILKSQLPTGPHLV